MNISLETQKNKLKTIFIDQPNSKVGTVQFWFKAGSSLEKEEDHGIAHFLEHMFFKGTKKRSKNVPAFYVESFGGDINAFTSFDYTCYYINFPIDFMEESVDILLDMVANAQFKNEDIPSEREVVFEEYKKSIDAPNQFQFMKIQETCFKNGYDHPILGNEKTIKNFSQKQLKNFRNNFYGTNNSFLILATDLKNIKKVKSKINSFSFPIGRKSNLPTFSLENKKSVFKHINKEVNQGTLTFCIQAPDAYHKDAPAQDLLMNCLFSGETSRFYADLVVNSQLASSVSGSTMFFNNGGLHIIKINFPYENFEKVTQAIIKTLKSLEEKPISNEEINKVKNQYLASKIYEKESIESFAFSIGHSYVQTENLNAEAEYIEKIKEVKVTEVNLALKQIFSQKIHINLLSSKEELKNAKTLLKDYSKLINNVVLFKDKKETSKKYKNHTQSKYDLATNVIELSENIVLCHRYNNIAPTYSMQAFFKGGLAHENAKNNGVYQLLSRVQTYSNKLSDYQKIRIDLETMSSSLNGFSGKNAFGLTQHALIDNFEKSFFHFTNTLISPLFEEQYFNLEKEMMIRALHVSKQDPVKQCIRKFNEIIFSNHPYARSVIGDEKSINSFTPKQLNSLYQKRLNNSKVLLTFCGDKPLNEVIDNLTPILSKLKSRKPELKGLILPKSVSKKYYHIDFDREQTHIMIGKQSFPSGNKNDLFLSFLTAYLSGQSSPLFLKVRDQKGLCYTVSAIQHSALEAGYFGIYIGTSNDKKVQAIESIKEQLEKIRINGFKKTDFERIKKMIEGQNQLSLQTNDDYAHFYSIPVLHNLGIDYSYENFNKIKNIKLNDLNEFLKNFLIDDFTIVTVGK